MNTDNISVESINFSKVLNSFYVYTGDLKDKYVQVECRLKGYWDMELTQWMINNLKPGWTCLDIGANIFYFTEIMARIVGSDGNVLSFEPINKLCRTYEAARILNGYAGVGNVRVFNLALSNEKADLDLNIWEQNIGGSAIVSDHSITNHGQFGNYHTEKIKAETLMSIYNEKIDFMKIDVEGHEQFVFEGFSDSANSCPLLVVELGVGQPDEFLIKLNNKYTMEFLNGEEATFEKIKQHSVVNVVLRKKAE
jgi:hypothetical protein